MLLSRSNCCSSCWFLQIVLASLHEIPAVNSWHGFTDEQPCSPVLSVKDIRRWQGCYRSSCHACVLLRAGVLVCRCILFLFFLFNKVFTPAPILLTCPASSELSQHSPLPIHNFYHVLFYSSDKFMLLFPG